MCYQCAAMELAVTELPDGNLFERNMRESFIAVAINAPDAETRARLGVRFSDLMADLADATGAVATNPEHLKNPELLRADTRERLVRQIEHARENATINPTAQGGH